MSEPRTVRFYFDYISPNAYLAWHVLGELAAGAGARVEPVPVLFAGLLDAHGQLGPAEIRAKHLWTFRNNLRRAAVLGVPLNPPASHPFNPLLALRITSLTMDDAARARLVARLFRAVWVEGRDVADPEVVAGVADAAGLEGARRVAETTDPIAKDRLRKATEDAVAAGVFGVPTMTVGDELFWGYDDLPFLERHLRGEDPLDPAAAAVWDGVAPSAARRR